MNFARKKQTCTNYILDETGKVKEQWMCDIRNNEQFFWETEVWININLKILVLCILWGKLGFYRECNIICAIHRAIKKAFSMENVNTYMTIKKEGNGIKEWL